ncbi:uncharacterized protein ATNIH1004_006872 [Aspergillus tanneri]|uniref:Alpha box domain-containing protein n=1 Tax=Aspergillus tanneri TaxID=1220188 RepID=A0A5M9MKF0_9EURO|nr:uncharacterized protein ATNIH1004_006872 [Aspergillus tanneri]KAA8645453.1 hypothetical protein ATNIH1004_006872 [Aspergillus tanneri]
MPPKRLEELLKYLQDAKTQENNQPLQYNKNTHTRLVVDQDNNYHTAISTGENPRSQSSRGKHLHKGKRRPLNSFIAFRSYYSVIFPELTQKAKSGILRFLWQNDPFKAKWAILAKAYSIIRDDHDTDAMGWQLTVDDQQQYTMARVSLTTTNEADTSTNYSVDDIVNNCYATGYVSEQKRKNKRPRSGNTPVMAFAAQPTLAAHENNHLQVLGNNLIVAEDISQTTSMELATPEQLKDVPTPNRSDLSTVVGETSHSNAAVPSVYKSPAEQGLATGNIFNFGCENLEIPVFNENTLFSYEPSIQAPMVQYDPLFIDPFEVFEFGHLVNA